jgi:hypothetical protein
MNNESINIGQNPFDTEIKGVCYADLLRDDLAAMEIGGSAPANLHGKTKERYRSMLTYAAADLMIQVKTKTNSDGVLWIKRIS